MKNRILVEPVWQTIWQWPAVVNLVCGGTACGFYLLNLFVQRTAVTDSGLERMAAFHLAAPLLVMIGFAAVAMEAGRPSAARYLLHHFRTSWMSREVLAGSFFILFAGMDLFFPQPALKLASALAAGGLLFSQAMMVYRCRAVITWNHALNLYHFVASGIYLGFGLLLLLYAPQNQILNPSILAIGLLSCLASLAVWHRLINGAADDRSFSQSIEPLRDARALTFTVGMAQIVPLTIILILLFAAILNVDVKGLRGICVVTGMVILLGGSAQKYYIILEANLLRELRAGHCANRLTP